MPSKECDFLHPDLIDLSLCGPMFHLWDENTPAEETSTCPGNSTVDEFLHFWSKSKEDDIPTVCRKRKGEDDVYPPSSLKKHVRKRSTFQVRVQDHDAPFTLTPKILIEQMLLHRGSLQAKVIASAVTKVTKEIDGSLSLSNTRSTLMHTGPRLPGSVACAIVTDSFVSGEPTFDYDGQAITCVTNPDLHLDCAGHRVRHHRKPTVTRKRRSVIINGKRVPVWVWVWRKVPQCTSLGLFCSFKESLQLPLIDTDRVPSPRIETFFLGNKQLTESPVVEYREHPLLDGHGAVQSKIAGLSANVSQKSGVSLKASSKYIAKAAMKITEGEHQGDYLILPMDYRTFKSSFYLADEYPRRKSAILSLLMAWKREYPDLYTQLLAQRGFDWLDSFVERKAEQWLPKWVDAHRGRYQIKFQHKNTTFFVCPPSPSGLFPAAFAVNQRPMNLNVGNEWAHMQAIDLRGFTFAQTASGNFIGHVLSKATYDYCTKECDLGYGHNLHPLFTEYYREDTCGGQGDCVIKTFGPQSPHHCMDRWSGIQKCNDGSLRARLPKEDDLLATQIEENVFFKQTIVVGGLVRPAFAFLRTQHAHAHDSQHYTLRLKVPVSCSKHLRDIGGWPNRDDASICDELRSRMTSFAVGSIESAKDSVTVYLKPCPKLKPRQKRKLVKEYGRARGTFAGFVEEFRHKFEMTSLKNREVRVYLNDTVADTGAFASRQKISFVKTSSETYTARINGERTSIYCGYARKQGDIESVPFLMLPAGLGFWGDTPCEKIPCEYVVQWGYEVVTRIKDAKSEEELIRLLKSNFLALCAKRRNAEQGV